MILMILMILMMKNEWMNDTYSDEKDISHQFDELVPELLLSDPLLSWRVPRRKPRRNIVQAEQLGRRHNGFTTSPSWDETHAKKLRSVQNVWSVAQDSSISIFPQVASSSAEILKLARWYRLLGHRVRLILAIKNGSENIGTLNFVRFKTLWVLC